MSFTEYIRKCMTKILSSSMLVALLMALIFPADETMAAGARFNFLVGDNELFQGLNVSKNETVLKDPVSGDAGNTFLGSIYYHNGVEDTVARDTRINVQIPSTTTNRSATLTAQISFADDSGRTTVSDTLVEDPDDGLKLVGLSGLTVNLNQDADISLVPGTVKWFPEVETKGRSTATTLPGGQSGDEIISSSGLSIGDIQGCWPFAGYVTFEFRTTPKVTNFTLQKQVRNYDDRNRPLVETVSAAPGDEVQFSLAFSNRSNQNIVDPRLKDVMPAELTFTPGTLELVDAAGTVTLQTDTIAALFFNGGWDTAITIAPNTTQSIRFRAKVNATANVGVSAVNTGIIIVNNNQISDTASVLISAPSITVGKSKTVVNNTTGKQAESKTVSGKTIMTLSAKAGDQLTYTLTTRNTGSNEINYTIEDGIADILEYADIVTISDGGSVVNGTTGLEAKLVRYPVDEIGAGQAIDRTFTVKVKDPLPSFPPKGNSYDDVILNIYGNEVRVTIERPQILRNAILTIKKDVRNFTQGDHGFVDANEAKPGDTLEYSVVIANSGNAPADQVKISDMLPANTQYIPGTTVMIKNDQERTLVDGIAGSGITIESIAAGETITLRFKILTSDKIANGEVLVNTVKLAHRETELTDTAKTTMKVVFVPAPKATPTPKLPRTGAAASSGFLITMMAGLMFSYMKYRRILIDQLEIVKIANDVTGF